MHRSSLDLTVEDSAFFSAFVVCNRRVNTVWLEGVIDIACEQMLDGVALMLRRDSRAVTVDMSRVTFCDARLTNFIAELQHDHSTCLRDAPRIALDLMTLAGLWSSPERNTPRDPDTTRPEVDLNSLRSSVAAEEVML